MVQSVSGVSIPGIRFAMANSGKMSVPVDPPSLMYSNFEHVSGIPAPEGSQGVSISRLHLLDLLIGQLNQARQVPSFKTLNPYEGMDGLIEAYRNQIVEADAASAAMPYIPSPNAQSGILFSFST